MTEKYITSNSAMKSVSTEILQKEEYDDKLYYGFCISAAIVQGEHELAFQFLTRNSDRKGTIELTLIYCPQH